ncbi:general transcription factor IIE subunit 2 [Trichogramma pretiosum]|uniref:general transcription factor IIE subunit 2 n=1 Tax=Trichogramma pretiosum TaxID=7493 RepID=UPI0006C94A88|nr:general transcription factor IIE subunit 2 [Trichogramma pretiosum]
MDPALFKEHEAFKKRAAATPSIEKKRDKNGKEANTDESFRKKPKPVIPSKPKVDINSYKNVTSASTVRFGILAKIVQYMKARHQDGDDYALSLDEILDETSQLDIGSRNKLWLENEALPQNPKIELTDDGKYIFKSMYKIKDKKSLLKLLKQHDLKGQGGIMLEDIKESLPHSEKHLKNLQNDIITIVRPQDKKQIIFYKDRTAEFPVDEDFQKLWRAVAVDAVDDAKMTEYLEKQGIRSMQDHGIKKMAPVKRKKGNNKKRAPKKPRDNDHLADVLQHYDDK